MKLVISHMSALRFLRASAPNNPMGYERICRSTTISDAVCSVKDAHALYPKDYGLTMNADYPLDVLVPSSAMRRPASSFAPHVWSGAIPRGSFFYLSDEIVVCRPEFVFLQLAQVLDEVELAQLALELCGDYSLIATSYSERYRPLTTMARLQRFVSRANQTSGATKAQHALDWAANGSATPMETNMVLALCLPQRFGGYGLPIPQLNPRLYVGKRFESLVSDGEYRPDCLWKKVVRGQKVRVTAEYDSSEWHDGPDNAERTRIRRNNFKTLGYLVTSVNKSQMRTAYDFQFPARQIARDLGLYRPELGIAELSRRDEVMRRLAHEEIR